MKSLAVKKHVRYNTTKARRHLTVGIITIPHSQKIKQGSSHIMKAYVEEFQRRGVRVIPIPYDTKEHEMYFQSVNGILIPGGDTPYIMKQPAFIETVTRFFELSLQKDEYFPIWGTCFGYEILLFLVGGFTRLKRYNMHGLSSICITEEGYRSRMISSFSEKYKTYLETKKSTLQNHEYGISPKDFHQHPSLHTFYDILATAKDEDGKEYVAIVEAKQYPIYGVQHHPERQKTGGPFMDFFVSELKKNKHRCMIHMNLPSLHKCIQYAEHKKLSCYFFE
jgi:gamma-glutamyl hydrolase